MPTTTAPPTASYGDGVVLDDLTLRRVEFDEAVCLEKAGPASRRVCDRQVPDGQGRFIGLVERKADLFEVMQIGNDFVWTTHSAIHAAFAHIVATHQPDPADQATRVRSRFR